MEKPSNGFVLSPLEKIMSFYGFHVMISNFYTLSSHQFGVMTKGGCEKMVHNIQCTVDVHLN
jgi:hypothetical protein